MIFSATDLAQLGDGEVLAAEMTGPEGEPVLRRAAAILTGTAMAVEGGLVGPVRSGREGRP